MEGPERAKIKKNVAFPPCTRLKHSKKYSARQLSASSVIILCVYAPFKLPRPVLELNDLTPKPSSVARSAVCLARIEASPRVMPTFSAFLS